MSLEKQLIPQHPSISTNELSAFRREIAAGKTEQLVDSIKANPKWIVTSCDFPTVLQLTTRYNALHVAAMANNPSFISFLLSYLESDDLLAQIGVQAGRRQMALRLLDLYINSPDATSLSTPLHFACRMGFPDCVRLLAHHPITHLQLKDFNGLTAQESACSRVSRETIEKLGRNLVDLKQSISAVFQERFVVLVDRIDRQQEVPEIVGPVLPWIVEALKKVTLAADVRESVEPVSALLEGTLYEGLFPSGRYFLRAAVGPLGCSDAAALTSEWRKPRLLRQAVLSLRRTDQQKGLERHGRFLAHTWKCPWTELWAFAEDFLDLRSEPGLARFEQHIRDSALGNPKSLIQPMRESPRVQRRPLRPPLHLNTSFGTRRCPTPSAGRFMRRDPVTESSSSSSSSSSSGWSSSDSEGGKGPLDSCVVDQANRICNSSVCDRAVKIATPPPSPLAQVPLLLSNRRPKVGSAGPLLTPSRLRFGAATVKPPKDVFRALADSRALFTALPGGDAVLATDESLPEDRFQAVTHWRNKFINYAGKMH